MRRHGTYRERAIVLKHAELGEADRIVTLFSQNQGRIRVVAKGARKSRSGSGARLDLFNVIDAQFYSGRDLDGVTQAVTAERFPEIAADLERFAAASAICDAAIRTTPERERNPAVYSLLIDSLRHLNARTHAPRAIAYYALARFISIGGHAPVLGRCAICGAGDVDRLSFNSGGTVCRVHATGSDPAIRPGALEVWRSFSGGFESCDASDSDITSLAGVLLAFASWQFDTPIRSFQMLEGVG